jgi:hypothetical protein
MTIKEPVEDFATDWDHTDPQWVADPYPIWDDLRQRCPVAHTERFGGGWFPATHEGVTAVARDTDNFTSRTILVSNGRPGDEAMPAPIGVAPPITSDPPFHAIARRIMLPVLAPGPVNEREPQVRALCRRLLDEMGDHEVVNAGTEYAQFIPPAVIQQLLGFPPEDEEKFREIIHVIMEAVDHSVEERIEEFGPVEEYFVKQIEDHRENPRDDFTTYLMNVEVEGHKLADEHIFGTMILTLIAGIDTTWSAIGSSLWHLATHPEDLERLVREPDLMTVALEEFLRFYAPVTMARLVKHDMEYLGCPMKADDWLLLGFPAANRDPAVFPDADKFIIDRAQNRHVAFGLGIRVALEEFIQRYPRFELADAGAVTWAAGQVRGARSLPVRILH